MVDLLGNLDYILVYIDDILLCQCQGKLEENHLKKIEFVLQLLKDIGFRTIFRKLFFMQKEVEYLGVLLTTDRLTPQLKKVEAMDRVKPSTNWKQLKRFFGMINLYCDL